MKSPVLHRHSHGKFKSWALCLER